MKKYTKWFNSRFEQELADVKINQGYPVWGTVKKEWQKKKRASEISGYHQLYQHYIMGFPRQKREKYIERVLEKIVTKNFPNWKTRTYTFMKLNKLQLGLTQRNPPTHNIIKSPKAKCKQRNLESSKKELITHSWFSLFTASSIT